MWGVRGVGWMGERSDSAVAIKVDCSGFGGFVFRCQE